MSGTGMVGMISLEQVKGPAQAVPMAIKRFDFLAKGGGDLSVEELVLAQKPKKTA